MQDDEFEVYDETTEREPDFTDDPLVTNPAAAAGPSSDSPDDPVAEQGDVYFPPTDPVVTTDHRGQTQILGGFSASSTDEVAVDRSASDGELGDEAIADAIRRELREDAATTGLRINVIVRRGVAHLRGVVEGPEDAELAEEVAYRVPGVVEVVEELEVASV